MPGNNPPAVMTIAGSDPSGGAGIQADLKTFTSLECYGTSVITALTAQNTVGVDAIHAIPPDFVERQLQSVLEDVKINAFKTGMLSNASVTKVVASTLKSYYESSRQHPPPIVVDPVCVSTSGHTLLESSALEVLFSDLFPMATLITPNKSEAELLLSIKGPKAVINSLEDAFIAAQTLSELGKTSVLLKGGHLIVKAADIDTFTQNNPDLCVDWERLKESNMNILSLASREKSEDALVIDILHEMDCKKTTLFVRPRIESLSTHGTGCTLSAALASFLSLGHELWDAVKLAAAYTHHGIETAFPLGSGHGPLNHLHPICPRLIPVPTPSNPYPCTKALINSNTKIWKEYVEHKFVRQLGEGVLPRECFIHFIKQDYLYLKYYARAYALLAAKTRNFTTIASAVQTILNVITETSTHKFYCLEFGVTEEELESTQESPATSAYGAYLLDVGLHGDETKLIMSLAACLLGYGEVGLWLKVELESENSWVKLESNPYVKWIEDYSGESYQEAVKTGLQIIEARAVQDPPSFSRFEEWKEVWGRCTRLEKGFWDMALNLS